MGEGDEEEKKQLKKKSSKLMERGRFKKSVKANKQNSIDWEDVEKWV